MKYQRFDRTLLLMLALVSVTVACSRDNTPVAAPVAPVEAPGVSAEAGAPDAVAEGAAMGGAETWNGTFGDQVAHEFCAIDLINGVRAVEGVFTVRSADAVVVEGWVASPELKAVPTFALFLQGSPHMRVTGATGKPREDVAQAFGDPTLLNSGFSTELAAGSLTAGEYAMFLGAGSTAAPGYCNPKVRLQVN